MDSKEYDENPNDRIITIGGKVHFLYNVGPSDITHSLGKVWKTDNDIIHRENGPAVIWDDYQMYVFNGKLHRLDGPAHVRHELKEWWINGRWVHLKIHAWAEEMGIDLDNLTDHDKTIIAMVWGEY